MNDFADVPIEIIEQVKMMEGILIAKATGTTRDGHIHEYLKQNFVKNSTIAPLLPQFVRTYRNLDAFWPFIKEAASTYAERRRFIYTHLRH